MGSAKIEVDDVKVRTLAADNGEIIRSLNSYGALATCKAKSLIDVFGSAYYVRQMVALCKVHDFIPTPIDYPRPRNGSESYKWFVNNRGGSNKPIIRQVLPEVPDNADALRDSVLAGVVSLEEN